MTSQITLTGINQNYPVAGQDNNSQGFRDNFGAIRTNLGYAKTELEDLQAKAILKDALDGQVLDNDLGGNSITNGSFADFHGLTFSQLVNSSQTTIDVRHGPLHVYTLTLDSTFTFRYWPDAEKFGCVRVHFKTNASGEYTPGIFTENGGIIVKDSSFPNPFTCPADGKAKVIEAWTYDGGANVFVRFLGTY